MNHFLESIERTEHTQKTIFYNLKQHFGRQKLSVETEIYIIANMPKTHSAYAWLYALIASAVCNQKARIGTSYNTSSEEITSAVAKKYHNENGSSTIEKQLFRIIEKNGKWDSATQQMLSTIIFRLLGDKTAINYERLLNDMLYWDEETRIRWERNYAFNMATEKLIEEDFETSENISENQ